MAGFELVFWLSASLTLVNRWGFFSWIFLAVLSDVNVIIQLPRILFSLNA